MLENGHPAGHGQHGRAGSVARRSRATAMLLLALANHTRGARDGSYTSGALQATSARRCIERPTGAAPQRKRPGARSPGAIPTSAADIFVGLGLVLAWAAGASNRCLSVRRRRVRLHRTGLHGARSDVSGGRWRTYFVIARARRYLRLHRGMGCLARLPPST